MNKIIVAIFTALTVGLIAAPLAYTVSELLVYFMLVASVSAGVLTYFLMRNSESSSQALSDLSERLKSIESELTKTPTIISDNISDLKVSMSSDIKALETNFTDVVSQSIEKSVSAQTVSLTGIIRDSRMEIVSELRSFKQSMETSISDFKEGINRILHDQHHGVLNRLSEVEENRSEAFKNLNTLIAVIGEAIKNRMEKILSDISLAMENEHKSLCDVRDEFRREYGEMIGNVSSIAKNVDGFICRSENLCDKFDEVLQENVTLQKAFGESIETQNLTHQTLMEEYGNKMRRISNDFMEGIRDSYKIISGKFDELNDELSKLPDDFKDAMEESLSDVLEPLELEMSKLEESIGKLDKYGDILEGLSSEESKLLREFSNICKRK